MNSPVLGLRVASVLFGLGCLAHLVRLIRGFQVLIGSHPVPMWMSGAGFVVLGLLCFWFWQLSLPAGTAAPAAPMKPITPVNPVKVAAPATPAKPAAPATPVVIVPPPPANKP